MQLLSIKDFTTEELGTICEWLNNKELMKYSEQRFRKHTIATQTAFIQTFTPPHLYYGIRADNHSETLIGTLTAIIDQYNGVAELGILVGHKNFRGKRYGYLAWQEAIEIMFGFGLRKIQAGCMDANEAMMRICERSGMFIEGHRNRRFMFRDGTYRNAVLWGKFR